MLARDSPRSRRQDMLGVPVGGSRVRPALDTHGRVLGQLERLGRPLSDLLPARRAFVTRDLAVLVVSTGASRRHGLPLVAAVRGRTLRWFRHGYLPCYARVSIRSRAPALGPQPSRHSDVSHPTGRAEPSKSAEKPTHSSPSSLTTEQPHRAWVRGQGGLRLSSRVLRAIPPPIVSRRRASWRVEGVVRRHEASPAGAPECDSLATPPDGRECPVGETAGLTAGGCTGGCCPSSSVTAHRFPSRVSRRRITAPGLAPCATDNDSLIPAETHETPPDQIENLGS